MEQISFNHKGLQITVSEDVLRDFVVGRLAGDTGAQDRGSRLPAIGSYWKGQGGVYVGMARGYKDIPDYPLVMARREDGGHIDSIQWGGYGKDCPDAKDFFDGETNTKALLAAGDHPVADFADKFNREKHCDGHTDFIIPARYQQALCYANLSGLGLIKEEYHWSSTQDDADYAWYQDFGNGIQDWSNKTSKFSAFVVRRVIL